MSNIDAKLFLWACDVMAASAHDYEKARTPKHERARMISIYNTMISVLEGKSLPNGLSVHKYDSPESVLSRIRDAKKSLESKEQ